MPNVFRATCLLYLPLVASHAAGAPASTLDRVEKLLDFADAPATCQPVPPTPNPEGPGESLTSCIRERDGAQVGTMRTATDRLVWLSYAGPWRPLDPGRAAWDTLRGDLERTLGAATRTRGDCVLWERTDGVVRATLLGSPNAGDPAVALLRIVVDAADTPGAVDC